MEGNGKTNLPNSIRTRMKLLNFNIWWTEKMEFLKRGFSLDKGFHLYCKGVRNVDDIWDGEHRNFLTVEKTKENFKLSNTEVEDWIELIDKISRK